MRSSLSRVALVALAGAGVLGGAVMARRAVTLARPSAVPAAPMRNGHVEQFWSDGHLRSEVTYRDDAYDGEYRTYYASGAPYELRHYTSGHEDGLQQSWTESGTLYLNYEVRSGRRYGLVNASPCNTVADGSAASATACHQREEVWHVRFCVGRF